jgi:hypothetical protein
VSASVECWNAHCAVQQGCESAVDIDWEHGLTGFYCYKQIVYQWHT